MNAFSMFAASHLAAAAGERSSTVLENTAPFAASSDYPVSNKSAPNNFSVPSDDVPRPTLHHTLTRVYKRQTVQWMFSFYLEHGDRHIASKAVS